MKQFWTFCSIMILFSSCYEQGDCTDVSTNIIKVGFYNFSDRKVRTIALDSIKISGTTLLYYKGQSASSVQLPLNPESDSLVFQIYFNKTLTSLDVSYKVNTFPLAPDCPAIDLYQIKDASSVSINEIYYTQKTVAKDVTENIKLFF